MKTYSFDFAGFWPIGACGVVVADNVEEARKLAEIEVKNLKLNPDSIEDLIEILPGTCVILNDGDY